MSKHLADMEFPEEDWPRVRLIDTLRQCGEQLRGNARKIEALELELTRTSGARGMLESMEQQLIIAREEADYWKDVADRLEFGNPDAPNLSPE